VSKIFTAICTGVTILKPATEASIYSAGKTLTYVKDVLKSKIGSIFLVTDVFYGSLLLE
jgi:hypothetical protein